MMQQARSMELAAKEVAYMKNNGIAASQAEQQPDIMDINQLERYTAQKWKVVDTQTFKGQLPILWK